MSHLGIRLHNCRPLFPNLLEWEIKSMNRMLHTASSDVTLVLLRVHAVQGEIAWAGPKQLFLEMVSWHQYPQG